MLKKIMRLIQNVITLGIIQFNLIIPIYADSYFDAGNEDLPRLKPDQVTEKKSAPYSIDQNQFYSSISKIEREFKRDFRARNRPAHFHADWPNPTVNAETVLKKDGAHFTIYGGLARHPRMNRDVFELILCHEVGHHVGGAPKDTWYNGSPKWSSVEGQADYFASLKCLRRIWKGEDHSTRIEENLPRPIVEKCEKNHFNKADQLLCQRTLQTALQFARLIADEDRSPLPDLETPSTDIVDKTLEHYPSLQCRLDTLLAGALCSVPVDIALSDRDPDPGTCSSNSPTQDGARPRCWYSP